MTILSFIRTPTKKEVEAMSQYDEQALDALEGLIISEMPVTTEQASTDLPEDMFDQELETDDEMFLSYDELAELEDERMLQDLPAHLRQQYASRKTSGKNKKREASVKRGSAKGKKKKMLLEAEELKD